MGYYYYQLNYIMSWQPVFTSFSFAISNYQITCGLDECDLKITVSSPQGSHEKNLFSLSKYAISNNKTIDLWISQFSLTGEKANLSKTQSVSHLLEEYSIKEKAMMQKIQQLQNQFQSLDRKLSTQANEKYNQKQTNKRNAMYQPAPQSFNAQHARQNEQNQDFENAKLQMLNCVLQQKLFEKQGQIMSIEKKLMERDQLVRQLADKLMVANIQKQDIFNQYEKILQNTVFSKLQEEKKLGSTLVIEETGLDLPKNQIEQENSYQQSKFQPTKIETQEVEAVEAQKPSEVQIRIEKQL